MRKLTNQLANFGLLMVVTGLAGVARADALDRVAEGASIYGEVRPVALAGALKRPGVDQSPEEKLGVIATASTTPTVTAVARISGETIIIDGVDVWSGKAMAAAEVARRYPLEVARPFQPGRGARRLFAGDTAFAVYADGRR